MNNNLLRDTNNISGVARSVTFNALVILADERVVYVRSRPNNKLTRLKLDNLCTGAALIGRNEFPLNK